MRYILATKIPDIIKRYELGGSGIGFKPSYNISPGTMIPIVLPGEVRSLQLACYGYTPFWSKQRLSIPLSRAEGDRNMENRRDLPVAKGIIQTKAFRHAIRSQRCLIPADGFLIPSSDGWQKPYVVFTQDNTKPFSMAGIWDVWTDPQTDIEEMGCAVVTITSNKLISKLGCDRMPVIISVGNERRWLKESTHLSEITAMLEPYKSDKMNAYPIAPLIAKPDGDSRKILDPIGQRVVSEFQYKTKYEIKRMGMGSGHKKKGESEISWAERLTEKINEKKDNEQ